MEVQPLQPTSHQEGADMLFLFPLMFGWSRAGTVTNVSIIPCLSFPVPYLERVQFLVAFSVYSSCHWRFQVVGFSRVQSVIFGRQKENAENLPLCSTVGSLASPPSWHLSESSCVCLLQYVLSFQMCLSGDIGKNEFPPPCSEPEVFMQTL